MERRSPRLALKPDSSFFRKIVIGVVGARAVAADLAGHGHRVVELERGSTDTKLWKDVKRKRVRIPDLLCLDCGLRVESRAKTKAELSMSHSPTDAERAWDYGMVNQDWVAFPVCEPAAESYWSAGDLEGELSYWHERNWVRWKSKPFINYALVSEFRAVPHRPKGTKGVTEGSETSVLWTGTFSTTEGVVDTVEGRRVAIRREADGRRRTRTIAGGLRVFVEPGEDVHDCQLIAGLVRPVRQADLSCPKALPADHIAGLLGSRERTQRFTGVKLARLRRENGLRDRIRELSQDPEEDMYVRLEACSYLASVAGRSARALFTEHLASADLQTQLETVIALGEAGTAESIAMLCDLLDDRTRPFFLRSAAAWALGRTEDRGAGSRLIQAFADVDLNIREEALGGLVALGGPAIQLLLENLGETEDDVAAGCAEALRWQQPLPLEVLQRIAAQVRSNDPKKWAVWLLGHVPMDQLGPLVADLQRTSPKTHYALSLLWSFMGNWIARRWELKPRASLTSQAELNENA